MAVYDIDNSIVTILRDHDTRLRRLENVATQGAGQDSVPTGGGGGGTVSGDYVSKNGDTMFGTLTLLSGLQGTSATFSGNVTISGTLTVSGGGSFALDSEVVHLTGTETITGVKQFGAEQRFYGTGTYSDPDTGVQRAIKIGAQGIAVNGGVKTDSLTASGNVTLNGTNTFAGGTFTSTILANAGITYGASSLLDLSPVHDVTATVSGQGVGDKIALWGETYGLGVQSNRLVTYLPAGARFAVRQAATSGHKSSGSDAVTFGVDGTLGTAGRITAGNGLTVSTGTISLPNGTIAAAALVNDSITGTGTGSQAAGVGKIASGTVGTYNIADGAVTSQKLSATALLTSTIPTGTANNTRNRFLRYVAATANYTSTDAAGQGIDGLRHLNGATRITDGAAYGGFAISRAAGAAAAIMAGPYYGSNSNDYNGSPGLLPGNYRLTVYMRADATSTSTADAVTVAVSNATANKVVATSRTWKRNEMGTAYQGFSLPFTVISDTAGTDGFVVTVTPTAAVGVTISHVRVEQYDGLAPGEVSTFIRAAEITSAQIFDLSATKLVAGTINSDGIFLGSGGKIYAGPSALPVGANQARVQFDSGGITAYDGTTQTLSIGANGTVTLKGSLTAGSTITGTVLSGTTGVSAGTGNNVFVAGSNGIQLGHATFGSAPFRVTMAGALTATSATIQGSISSSTMTTTNLDATNTISGLALVGKTVTADKLSVGVATSDDLVINGDFTDVVGTTTEAAGWTPNYETSGSTISQGVSTEQAFNGSTSYKMNLGANGGTAIASQAIPVRAAQVYAIKARLFTTSNAGNVYVRVVFGTADGFARNAVVGTTPTGSKTTPVAGNTAAGAGYFDILSAYTPFANAWTNVTGTVTVPTGATWMRVVLYGWQQSNSWNVYWDGIEAREQITGTEISGNTITTGHIVTAGLDGDVITANSMSADRIESSTLHTSTVITAGVANQNRVEIDGRTATVGIRAYNSSNLIRFDMNGSTGNLTITGEINAAGGTFSGNITSSATITGGTLSGTTINGGSLDIGSGAFQVTTAGALTATAASITGTVLAGSASGTYAKLHNVGGANLEMKLAGIAHPGGVRMLTYDKDGVVDYTMGQGPASRPGIELRAPSASNSIGLPAGASIILGAPNFVNGHPENHSTIFLNASRTIMTSHEGFEVRSPFLTGQGPIFRRAGDTNTFGADANGWPIQQEPVKVLGIDSSVIVRNLQTTNGPLNQFGGGGMMFRAGEGAYGWEFQSRPGINFGTTAYSGLAGHFVRATEWMHAPQWGPPSSREIKNSIAVADDLEPVKVIKNVRAKRFRYKEDKPDRSLRLGFIAEELPEELQMVHPDTGELIGYNAVAVIAFMWDAIRELAERIPGPKEK